MCRYLITQTLISSWGYMFKCREECFDNAYQSFIETLNRIKKEPTEEMQNGIDFENLVYGYAAGEDIPAKHPWKSGVEAVATRIKGAQIQVKAQRELTIGETKILAYGILDALKAGVVYDVKFSNTRFSSVELAGKYLDSSQHSAYLYMIPEAYQFQYLVSDGVDLYTETYNRTNVRPFSKIVEEFLNSINSMGLMPVFKEKWLAK